MALHLTEAEQLVQQVQPGLPQAVQEVLGPVRSVLSGSVGNFSKLILGQVLDNGNGNGSVFDGILGGNGKSRNIDKVPCRSCMNSVVNNKVSVWLQA